MRDPAFAVEDTLAVSKLLSLAGGLRLPLIVAPMFLVSSPELVLAACQAGVLASLPTLNARTTNLLDEWLQSIAEQSEGLPWSINLVVHRTNERLEADLAVCLRHRVPVVIASVGSPARVADQVHSYGGLVIADVASVAHARKAVEAGVDGLLLLSAGAGGNTGWLNPLAFLDEVRSFFDGLIILAGGIGTGRAMCAALVAGADMVAMGTSFIAAAESLADPAYRKMLIACGADDVVLTDQVTGLPANMLRPSLEQAGLDADPASPVPQQVAIRRWRDVWSAGHGVTNVRAVEPLGAIVDRLEQEFVAAAGDPMIRKSYPTRARPAGRIEA